MAPRKQEEIFQATLELLAGRGYEGLTVEGVAEDFAPRVVDAVL